MPCLVGGENLAILILCCYCHVPRTLNLILPGGVFNKIYGIVNVPEAGSAAKVRTAMDPVVDLVWRLAHGLSRVGLLAALVGIALVGFGSVTYFKRHPEASDKGVWRRPLVRTGMIVFFCGVALSLFVFSVRLWGSP